MNSELGPETSPSIAPSSTSTPTSSSSLARADSSNNQRQTTPFRVYFRWTNPLVTILLKSLIKSKERALQTDGGFKSAAWDTALEDLVKAGADGCTVKSCKNKYQEQRRIWKEWLLHKEVSGWGWDEERGVPVAAPEVMDTYFTKYPVRAPFRYNPPEFVHDLAMLIGDRVARGKHAGGVLSVLAEYDVEGEGLRDSIEPSIEDSEDSTPPARSSPDYSGRPSANKHAAKEMYNSRAKKPVTGSRLLVDALNRSTQAFVEAFDRAGERLDMERQKKTPIQAAVDIVHNEMKEESAEFRVKLLLRLTEGSNAEIFNSMMPDERAVYAMELGGSQGLAATRVATDSGVKRGEGDGEGDGEGESNVDDDVQELSASKSSRPRRKRLRRSSR